MNYTTLKEKYALLYIMNSLSFVVAGSTKPGWLCLHVAQGWWSSYHILCRHRALMATERRKRSFVSVLTEYCLLFRKQCAERSSNVAEVKYVTSS